MKLNFIHNYIQSKVNSGELNKEIARELLITPAMVGQYRLNRGYHPSIHVAKTVYELDGTVLHPYSEDSIKHEIEVTNNV